MRTKDMLMAIKIELDALKGSVLLLSEQATKERLGESDRIVEAIGKVQPATVDLTQEMADDIVRKIHGPLTISKEFSEWIRGQAEFKDVYWTTPLGYSAMAGQMELRLKTDGSLYLELRDAYGANMWRGSFVPPDYGVTDEPG